MLHSEIPVNPPAGGKLCCLCYTDKELVYTASFLIMKSLLSLISGVVLALLLVAIGYFSLQIWEPSALTRIFGDSSPSNQVSTSEEDVEVPLSAIKRTEFDEAASEKPKMVPLYTSFESFQDHVVDQVVMSNPTEAFRALEQGLAAQSEYTAYCHRTVHEIAHRVWDQKPDFAAAMAYGANDLCGSGYIHGVVEEFIESNPHTPVATLTKEACPNVADGRCYHGLGHGYLLATKSNTRLALHYCSTLLSDARNQVDCSDGVFMQLWETDGQAKGNSIVTALCSITLPQFQSSCYFYGVRGLIAREIQTPAELTALCGTFEFEGRQSCIKAIGSGYTKRSPRDIAPALEACALFGSGTEKETCYRGIISYYSVHLGKYGEATDVCTLFPETEKSTCARLSPTSTSDTPR